MVDRNSDRTTILIVDDSPESLDVLVTILKGDYRVKVAPNGKRALNLARSEPKPELILLDILMPDMDGYEVCRQLKNDPITAGIPVIFASAMESESDKEKGLQLGASDFVAKPYSAETVRDRVATQLEIKHDRDRRL